MLRSMEELLGYAIHAKDGDIGAVNDFFFDDESWTIRYLVVDTGTWLPGRLVLVSPIALKQPDWAANTLSVELTKKQVESSPDVDSNKPVSRQKEIELHQHFGWPYYWGGGVFLAGGMSPIGEASDLHPKPSRTSASVATEEPEGDPHLRSSKEVTGYHIQATDGEIGHLEDFIVDDQNWAIRYMVVGTRNWWPGKKVLVSPQWIRRVSWEESKVYVELSRDAIKTSPEYEENLPITRAYESRLYDHYGRPTYWF
jgi:sporulation protein YlmC with PRC-barrel domain